MNKTLTKIKKNIKKNINEDIECFKWHSSVVLEGEVDKWEDVILAGRLAANKGYKGVVNNIEVKGLNIPKIKSPLVNDNSLENRFVDILIIGGGVIGCSIARELSKWDCSVLLLEKEEDLAMHTSSRNDGMIHPGLVPKPGTKKAYFNVKGNKLYSKVTKELDVSFKRIGSLILLDKNYLKVTWPLIKRRAKLNKVKGVKLLSKKELIKKEPNISKGVVGAIYIPSTGVLSPYEMTLAYGENAVDNGVKISLNTIVESIEKIKDKIVSVKTNRGKVYPKLVINAAGVYADYIAEMAKDKFFTIHPRKGEIVLLDKKRGAFIESVLAKLDLSIKNSKTKGGGLVKTIEGNILVGPNAYEQPFKEDYITNKDTVDKMLNSHLEIIPKLSKSDVITYFAGTRAATYEEDFIVERSEYVKNLVYAAGIQSPGLASAPAIAREIKKISIDILKKQMNIKKKNYWNPKRKKGPKLNLLTLEERNKLIKERSEYGDIICRCEEISKGEIIDALNSKIPASSIDAIKRRTRAGMGRCQGGFCMPLITKIIKEEKKIDMTNITKKGKSSFILVEETKCSNKEGEN
ncbi:MAG: NAD(P)/FAD-dependent oxidoreductase [Firmicutes bacterium]|nr:NAD(P)/FAD-dependent oxidoreductase [Bacillota bacterium]